MCRDSAVRCVEVGRGWTYYSLWVRRLADTNAYNQDVERP